MSLFVPSSCNLVGDTVVNSVSWCQNETIAAVVAYSIDDQDREINQVFFINIEGEIIPSSEISHDSEAKVMDWHPTEKILAIGWEDGMISTWLVDGKNKPTSSYSNNSQHRASISVLRWNPSGKRIVTGDKSGAILVWSANNRGSLSNLRQYKKKGEITSIVFCIITLPSPTDPINAHNFKGNQDFKASNYSPSFFCGTSQGSLIYADDIGHCTEVHQLSSSIDVMLFFEERSRLIIINRAMFLTQYHVSDDGKVTRLMQVKLSISGDISERGLKSVVWAGPGIVAAATEEKMVRIIDIAGDESYNLSLSAYLGGYVNRTDKVSCVCFSSVDRYLAVGTCEGVVAIFKFNGSNRDFTTSKSNALPTRPADWELTFRISLAAEILHLSWYGGRGCLSVVKEDGLVILNESIIQAGISGELRIIQDNDKEVSVHYGEFAEAITVKTGLQIKGLSIGRSCFVVWNGKLAKVYTVDLQTQRITPLETIKTGGMAMAIADSTFITEDAWFVADGFVVKINNFKGTQKQTINFSETEGLPQNIDINGKFLAVITTKGFIKVFDVYTPTKPKQVGSTGQFFASKIGSNSSSTSQNDLVNLKIHEIKINCSGSMVAILCQKIEGSQKVYFPDHRVFVFDRNKGSILTYDFSAFARYPVSIHWDESDERLLACEANKSRNEIRGKEAGVFTSQTSKLALKDDDKVDTEGEGKESSNVSADLGPALYLLFVTSDQGIFMQDCVQLEGMLGQVIGISVPRIYYRKTTRHIGKDEESPTVASSSILEQIPGTNVMFRIMRDFVGISGLNSAVKQSLLDFSFFLTLGKLDDAYRVVKDINSPGIWENMAQMCVKTKRLDVAEVCLGNMGHARGAAAVREAKKEGSLEVAIGMLAIQLGLLDDAASLFREAGRFDVLNNLYQAAGLWQKAISIAETKDRIHLKSTHYQYAKYLESMGRVGDAIEHFQLSDNARNEVPRMLFHLGRIDDLGDYILQTEDPQLLKWWASYLESIGRLDKARKIYSKAKDYLSLVRIYCFQNELQKAAEIISDTNDRASAYHFARQLENQGDFQEAINFYAVSGCYNHSIRLARHYGFDAELMRYALKSTQALMIECAQYFEEKGEYDKAMQLYHKGEDTPRALELCFRVGENNNSPQANIAFDMINSIAQELGAHSSPQLLARCADFLVQHKQYEKAIDLYVMAKRFMAAVEMCLQSRVTINDDMVEKLTPPENMDSTERKEILKDLAKALKKQGSFTLASKKYTQAGDRIRAIKCLVQSGDTKAVIQFATISRHPEIYTLAANYLQQMNWRESVDILKAIVTFYTKAKSFVQLATFYDSLAQVEIDEYGNYEKSISAMNESLTYLAKDTSRAAVEMAKNIEKKILLVSKFVEAKSFAKRDPSKTVAICEALLQDPGVEDAIKVGDCLALLIEHFHRNSNFREAFNYIKEMEDRKIQPHLYLEPNVLEEVYKSVGYKNSSVDSGNKTNTSQKGFSNTQMNQKNLSSNDDLEEEIGEEIDEELEEDIEIRKKSPLKSTGRNGIGRK